MAAQKRPISSLRPGRRNDEVAALLVLIESKALSLDGVSAYVVEFGSAVHALASLEKNHQITVNTESIHRALRTVEAWRAKKLDFRGILDDTYPRNLTAIHNAPPLIFVKGEWDDDRDRNAIAVVGTRKPSQDGLKRAHLVATRLASAGITVLSGLALGIDTAAHTAALDCGGRTAAVMGTGIDRVYPRQNEVLAERIVASNGALLTQFLPGHPPAKWSFPMRNVVMSGLSIATLVIEAGETSGAKSQARNALEHGRTVFLPRSLVSRYEWAQKMVSIGIAGVRAVEVKTVGEVVDRILAEPNDLAEAI